MLEHCWILGQGLLSAACNTTEAPGEGTTGSPLDGVTPQPNPFPDSPTNSPAPAATCGDMNGGGDQHVDFAALKAAKSAEKAEAMARQQALLEALYDLSDDPSPGVTMTRGKPVQQGVRVKLAEGLT